MSLSETVRCGKTAVTYDAAADHFDDEPLGFWDRHGRGAVDRLHLQPGEKVLDVGCGTGASALPAAKLVGPQGEVVGIDIAENMLVRARAKAHRAGLTNARFDFVDMADSGFASDRFDGVVSVFSLFFVPDMERQLAELWRLLKPGGQILVTVWAEDAFQPAATIFSEGLKQIRPDWVQSERPWVRLTVPENLHQLFLDAGTSDPIIEHAEDRQPLTEPDDWWTIAMGSGFRWEIDQLQPVERSALRTYVIDRLKSERVGFVETSALHAIARK